MIGILMTILLWCGLRSALQCWADSAVVSRGMCMCKCCKWSFLHVATYARIFVYNPLSAVSPVVSVYLAMFCNITEIVRVT